MQFLPPSLCASLHKMREREKGARMCVCVCVCVRAHLFYLTVVKLCTRWRRCCKHLLKSVCRFVITLSRARVQWQAANGGRGSRSLRV